MNSHSLSKIGRVALHPTRMCAVILLPALLSLSACAPKDEAFKDNRGGGNVTPRSAELANRDLELSRHMLHQIGEVRRLMDIALNLEVEKRVRGQFTTPEAEASCMTLAKIPIEPDTRETVKSERFSVSYLNGCVDVSADPAVSGIAQASKRGSEKFTIRYTNVLPKPEDLTPISFFPETIAVVADDIYLRFNLSNRFDRLNVNRNYALNATLESETETEAMYLVSFSAHNVLSEYNVGLTMRDGFSEVTLDPTWVRVDKASRRVVGLVPGQVSLTIRLTQQTKSVLDTRNATLTPPASIVLDGYVLKAKGPVALSAADSCSAPEGTFEAQAPVKKNAPAIPPVVLTTGKDSVSAGDLGTRVLRVCDPAKGSQPVFADSIAGLFNF